MVGRRRDFRENSLVSCGLSPVPAIASVSSRFPVRGHPHGNALQTKHTGRREPSAFYGVDDVDTGGSCSAFRSGEGQGVRSGGCAPIVEGCAGDLSHRLRDKGGTPGGSRAGRPEDSMRFSCRRWTIWTCRLFYSTPDGSVGAFARSCSAMLAVAQTECRPQ